MTFFFTVWLSDKQFIASSAGATNELFRCTQLPRGMSWKGSAFKETSLCLCITSEEVGRCGGGRRGLGFPKNSQACPSNDFLDGSCRTGLAGAGNQRQQVPGRRVPAAGRLSRSRQGGGALVQRSARTRFAAREDVGDWSETRPLLWLPERKDRWMNGCMAASCHLEKCDFHRCQTNVAHCLFVFSFFNLKWNYACVQTLSYYCILLLLILHSKLGFVHIQVEVKRIWLHMKRFIAWCGGFFFPLAQPWFKWWNAPWNTAFPNSVKLILASL